ncbi:DsrE family protein [Desulfotomaculum sp. 1211_IL3151]|uniref:DsrE family protein n=1 Tax=Desulfotomaculum sp. 1211_IL3151 TaxID=3084055 RepID=UPI002FDB86EE
MQDELVVIWTSGDRDVAIKMVFMYSTNSMLRGWWEKITLMVWGASSKLLTEDKELQDHIKRMQELGVNVIACKSCSDSYGITEALQALGVDVKYTGQILTNYIKNGNKVITF